MFKVLFFLLFVYVIAEREVIMDEKNYITYTGYYKKLIEMKKEGSLTQEMSYNFKRLKKLLIQMETKFPHLKNSQNVTFEEDDDDDNMTNITTTDNSTKIFLPLIEDPSHCQIHIRNPSGEREILRTIVKKKRLNLIKYKINFIEYSEKNLTLPKQINNYTEIYRVESWYHVFSEQGRHLLALSPGFDVKSLNLLSSGVEEVEVEAVEKPFKCFFRLETFHQKRKLKSLLRKNFFNISDTESIYKNKLCFQKVEKAKSEGKFIFECCDNEKCEEIGNKMVDIYYICIIILKAFFLLVCPLIIQKLFYPKSIGKFTYTVPLDKPGLKKTMLVRRVNSGYEPIHRSSKFLTSNYMKNFSNFSRLVKPIPSNEIVSVNFNRLDVTVDHSELMAKNESPIQFLQYIYSSLLRCECGRSHPFRTCCGESIIGSWSSNFLWCKLQKKCETNNSCRECCSWFVIFRTFSTIFLIILLPLPFYFKVFFFYSYEKDQLDSRLSILDHMSLNQSILQILRQGLTKHICYVGLFLCYFISAIIFFILKSLCPNNINHMIKQTVTDFRSINRFECFRMIMSHLVLPFEKFGIFGIVVAFFYWPIVLPISILLTIIYCIPLLYMVGRFLILERPKWIDNNPNSNQQLRNSNPRSISRNVSSIANCFFLNYISPKNQIIHLSSIFEKPLKKSRFLFCCSFNKAKVLSFFKGIIIGLIFIVLLLSVCIMYTEAFGFLLECLFFVFLGVFINSHQFIFILIFGSFIILHVVLFVHHIKWKYAKFSYKLFESFQEKVKKQLHMKMIRCGDMRENTAFKYFSLEEINDKTFRQNPDMSNLRVRSNYVNGEKVDEGLDNIEYISGKLHWTISSLVLFIDGHDVIRMPRDFFWRACSLSTPTSPGPLWRTLLICTVKLIVSFIYLSFFFLIYLFFESSRTATDKELGENESISRPFLTLQIIFLLIFGLLPTVIYVIVQFCRNREESLMMGEGISWVVKSYKRSFPVFDLVFENPESPKIKNQEAKRKAEAEGKAETQMPLKVDLLITLKEEPPNKDDPNRISMASNGSAQSLNSIDVEEEVQKPFKPTTYSPPPLSSFPNNVAHLTKPLISPQPHHQQPKDSSLDMELTELTNNLSKQVT